MSVVKLAGDDNIISKDIVKHVAPIPWNHDTQKEYLTEAELRQLESITFEKNDEVRRAALFSCYTGLRRSDILQLQWKDIVGNRKGGSMHLIIKKTKVEVRLPPVKQGDEDSCQSKAERPCLPRSDSLRPQ